MGRAEGNIESMNTETQPATFTVRTGHGTVRWEQGDGYPLVGESFTDEIGFATREPQTKGRFTTVRYHGRRYRLGGGIRTPLFISLNNPLPLVARCKGCDVRFKQLVPDNPFCCVGCNDDFDAKGNG